MITRPWLLWLLVTAALGAPGWLVAQNGSIAGTVRAEGSLEPIPFATVQVPELGRGVMANERGYFVLPAVPAGNWTVRASTLGYEPAERAASVTPGNTSLLELFLPTGAVEIAGIEVRAERERGITSGAAGPGPIRVDPAAVDAVPALAEADVLRTLQTLPAVQAVSDFSSALYVRGGSPDQNLMLLDGAPLFNPFHLGGIFGSVDPEAIAAVNMLPGAFPARVGDRVSGVVEIRTREGGRDRVRGNASAGLVSSRLGLDGPLPGARGSFLLSARRTYLDLFTDAADALGVINGTIPYSFSDANLKLSHDVGDLGRLSLSLHYDGEDVDIPEELEIEGTLDIDFGTRSASLNYWQPFGVLTTEVRAAISSFDGEFMGFGPGAELGGGLESPLEQILRASTTIRNALLAGDATWHRGAHQLRTGLQLDQYWFDYDIDATASNLGSLVPDFQLEQSPLTLAGYLEDQWLPSDALEVRLGMRVLAAGARGTAWMPRFGVQYQLTPRIALSVGVGRYAQVLHSLRDEESLAASLVAYDLLAAVPEEIGLIRSDDVVAGAAWTSAHTLVRADAYAKRVRQLPVNRAPDDALTAPIIVTEGYAQGEGRSWGLELLGRHRREGAEFSLGYAYLVARRSLGDETYSPRFERRHTLDATAALPWGKRGQVSTRFIFGSGQPYTPAIGVAGPFVFDPERKVFTPVGSEADRVVVLGSHNSARLPHYLRLDVAARRDFATRWFGREVVVTPYLQVLNVLNTRNVLFADPVATGFGHPVLEYAPQLPTLPTFGVELKF